MDLVNIKQLNESWVVSNKMRSIRSLNQKRGFTLVETLIVIVIIGILSAIIYVSYKGITHRAIESSLLSDLKSASSQLEIFKTSNKHYPTTINCSVPDSSTNLCLRPSNGNTYSYTSNLKAKTFGLTASNGSDNSLSYRTNGSGATIACPVGYIIVPGSKTYGTSDFCTMKYEAKDDGNGNPVSVSAGDPWVYVPQIDASGKTGAINLSKKVCSGCHLMTEAEWMTIAQNVLNVASNWSNNSVGHGYIYSGHNDAVPDNRLPADADDTNGYYGTQNFAREYTITPTVGDLIGDSQRRTLTLSNGEVIWDFSGNVSEWTDAQISGGQPGVTGAGFAWREFSAVVNRGSLAVNIFPDNLGIPGSGNWDAINNNIGQIGSDSDDSGLHGFSRGGDCNDNGMDGVLSLRLNRHVESIWYDDTGFRVSK